MLEFAGLPLDQRVSYFQEVANRRGFTCLIVEKDFWVCFLLRLLFSTPALADKFVFKGGTSLSKVFGIIKRLSEGKDLSVDPDWLGFGGENLPDVAKPGSLRLVPAASHLADLKADHQQIQRMFIEPPPPFNEILRQLRIIEDTLNKG